jgi:hypothetical protein
VVSYKERKNFMPADSPGDACLYFIVDSAAGPEQTNSFVLLKKR